MCDQFKIVERKIESFNLQLNEIQEDFRNNLSPIINNYLYQPTTRVVREGLQEMINLFLERNNLKINVHLYINDQTLYILGDTLADQLIWNEIQ